MLSPRCQGRSFPYPLYKSPITHARPSFPGPECVCVTRPAEIRAVRLRAASDQTLYGG